MTPVPAEPSTALTGLSPTEAARRLAVDGANELPASPPRGLLVRMLRELVGPLPLLLLGAAVVTGLVLDDRPGAVAILAIVLLNALVAAAQERRADAANAALRQMTAPMARVRRQGGSLTVPAREVVRGDLLELAAGDRIPADARLEEAAAMAVDEALLTGEAFPVDKSAGEEVSGGTLVVRGRGLARVLRTGPAAAIGLIAAALPQGAPTPLVRQLRRVAARMSALAVLLGMALVPLVWLRGGRGLAGLDEAALFGVALAVAAIPEGLLSVVTLALAVGGRRMAAHGAIVRHLPAVEALGSTSVLCVDKTGTLTTGHLRVAEVVPAPGLTPALWQVALRCNDADGATGDPLDVALRDEASHRGVASPAGTRLDERPFDAAHRTMATVHDVGGALVLSVKGAPEAVFARCRPGPVLDTLAEVAADAAARGHKVLAFADARGPDLDAEDLRPLGVIAFEDPLRDSARATVSALHQAGVRLVLVTGDHPATASTIAAAVGIPTEPTLTGAQLEAMDDRTRPDMLRAAAVIARVSPEVKRELVEAHRAAGEVVAMTGDGVNDAPALRQADVGVAVAGAAGTDVAREAADMVVTNADLGTVTAAVREGRRIGRNLAAAMAYLLSGNLSEIGVILATLVLLPEVTPALLPVQLLWINLVTDGVPALALAVDTPPGDGVGRPLAAARTALLPWRLQLALAGRAAVATAAVMLVVLGFDHGGETQPRALIVLALPFTHLLLAYVARRPEGRAFAAGWWRGKALLLALLTATTAQVLAFTLPPLRTALGLSAVPVVAWPAAIAAAVATVAVIDAGRWLRRRVRPPDAS